MTTRITRKTFLAGAGGLALAAAAVSAKAAPRDIEWPQYGGDQGFSRYSPANLINTSNVKGLKILWTRPAIDESLLRAYPSAVAAKNFRATPIMIGGILYSPNGIGFAEAFDAANGKTIWVQQPFSSDPSEISAQPSRGVAYWKKGREARILSTRGKWLYSLDARTGQPDKAFGEGGRVSLERGPDAPFSVSGGPLVARNLVIVGGMGGGRGTGDHGVKKEAYPESVRAFDVRTGKLVWEFSPMPAVGDPARATWGDGSADYAGNMGSYGTFTFDDELGFVFAAFSSPNPHYGGWRPGDNLYSSSLVALDVKTGRKVWFHQLVHHDIWDADMAAPPVLGYSDAKGRRIKTVMQVGKSALLFTFDRRTGEPIWPIEERPVPPSSVPGESVSPTQPFPTKPAPLDRIQVAEDDLIDFTPELRKEALAIYDRYEHGPLYTPPPLYAPEKGKHGVLTLPGFDGGGNWNTGAFDWETGTYYAATNTTPASHAWLPAEQVRPGATVRYLKRMSDDMNAVKGPRGLPLVKPPYGRITAVDMNTGEFRWVTPIGEGPRNHPELKALNLPRLGIPARAAPAVTKSLIFAGQSADVLLQAQVQGGYASKFNAYDKATGEMLVEIDLPEASGTTGAPMTYVVKGKQYVVVCIGGLKSTPAWVVMGLDD